jgi:hypothetical protein
MAFGDILIYHRLHQYPSLTTATTHHSPSPPSLPHHHHYTPSLTISTHHYHLLFLLLSAKQIKDAVFMPTESPSVASMWEQPGSGIPEVCKSLYKKGSNQDLRICSRGQQGRFTGAM